MTLYEPPASHILMALLVLAGAYAGVAGVRMMRTALRRGDALHLIRGIRILFSAWSPVSRRSRSRPAIRASS